jgi:hypothetical protein
MNVCQRCHRQRQKKIRNFEIHFLKIFCSELSLVHFTPKKGTFAYFSFLGVGKLILAGLSVILGFLVISGRFQRHWRKILSAVINCSPVWTPLAINCSPVSTTPPINFSTGDKLDWQQRTVLSAKLSPAAEVSHGRRYCHWNSHEKAQRHTPWSEAPEAAKTTSNQNGFI